MLFLIQSSGVCYLWAFLLKFSKLSQDPSETWTPALRLGSQHFTTLPLRCTSVIGNSIFHAKDFGQNQWQEKNDVFFSSIKQNLFWAFLLKFSKLSDDTCEAWTPPLRLGFLHSTTVPLWFTSERERSIFTAKKIRSKLMTGFFLDQSSRVCSLN